jgi:flagellar assembly protein FliH
MSKVLDSDSSGKCLPWQAPQFDQGAAGANRLRTSNEQNQIEQEAFDQGFNQGYAEGMKQAQKDARDNLKYLQSLISALASPLRELDKKVVDELVDLSMAVARQIIRRELKTSPGEIVAVVKEAVNLLPVSASDVSLELHPEDAALVRNALLPSDADTAWQIIEDPLLSRGGCRVSTNTSRIDATVENRINAAIAAVLGGERDVD